MSFDAESDLDAIRCITPDVLVEQSGVLATLSRWRSWVQIPSGTLERLKGRHGTQTGKAAKLALPFLSARRGKNAQKRRIGEHATVSQITVFPVFLLGDWPMPYVKSRIATHVATRRYIVCRHFLRGLHPETEEPEIRLESSREGNSAKRPPLVVPSST